MFDLLYGLGGRLDIRNRQGLTPLTLAAKLARKEVLLTISKFVKGLNNFGLEMDGLPYASVAKLLIKYRMCLK